MATYTTPKKRLLIYLSPAIDAKVRTKAKRDKRPLSTTFEIIIETYFALEMLKDDKAKAKVSA